MNIPNDTGGLWRINKFVEYQNEVPPIHREIFLSWKLEKTPSTDEMIVASFLMANTYNELTVLFLMEKIAVDNDWLYNFENFWNKNKSNIQFGSAKKYIKMNDRKNKHRTE